MRDRPPPRRPPSRSFDRLARGAWSLTSSLVSRLRAALGDESRLLFALTVVIGLLCGFAAVLFHLAIDLAQRLLIDRALLRTARLWWLQVLLLPAAGGLVAGALLQWVVPGARGSGIPQVKKAFALDAGRVPFRDAVGKFFLTTIQVGTGASLGREGPTVQICAGIASLLARAARLPPKNMRRLTPVGVAAGIAAAFNAPVAAVTFTIEEIVGSLDHSVLSGVVVAAALAAVIERSILGVHPMIRVEQAYGLDDPRSLLPYALLGVAAAVVSVAFTDALLALRAGFKRMRGLPAWAQPAVGGLATGALAVLALAALDTTGVTAGGYATLQRALAGQLALRALAALCALKVAATVASYSSGGAGGVFAPSLFIGAMLGGAVGHLDVALFAHGPRSLGSFALVGMGAVFAGVIRAPITSVLIIFEMTGAYGLVLPLMLANATSYVLARHWRPVPLYEALLAQDGVTLPHVGRAEPHALDALTVRDAMTRGVVTGRLGEAAATLRARVGAREFSEIPVVDDAGALAGAIPRALLVPLAPDAPIDGAVRGAVTIAESAPLIDAVVRMNERAARHLFVTGPGARELLGVLTISDVVRAHALASPRAADGARAAARTSLIPAAVTAGALAVDAPALARGTRVDAVLDAIEATPPAACVVIGAQGEPIGVVLLSTLREFVRDRELQKMLIADDVVQRAPIVGEREPLERVIARFADPALEALLVRGDDGAARILPRGTVAEHALAAVRARLEASGGDSSS
ncbi:MAG: chloride channel protein [Polyangiales bacterium]